MERGDAELGLLMSTESTRCEGCGAPLVVNMSGTGGAPRCLTCSELPEELPKCVRCKAPIPFTIIGLIAAFDFVLRSIKEPNTELLCSNCRAYQLAERRAAERGEKEDD